MSKLKIICDGDSWVFGSEIADPKISERYDGTVHPGKYDWLPENDTFRIPKIFTTHLAKIMNAEVTNLSWPADDNGTILNRTISYITENYIDKKISTTDLFVIIGWSSPERTFFWYKNEKDSRRFRLWPQVEHFDFPNQKSMWEYYITYLWNPEEYIPRYIMNVLQFQNFCNVNNIKWLCFNSFYQTPGKNPKDWNDLDVSAELQNIHLDGSQYHISTDNDNIRHSMTYNYLPIWNSIDSLRFYKKDLPKNTFRSFIEEKNVYPIYNGWHPSPESHKIWAEELIIYINENNLL